MLLFKDDKKQKWQSHEAEISCDLFTPDFTYQYNLAGYGDSKQNAEINAINGMLNLISAIKRELNDNLVQTDYAIVTKNENIGMIGLVIIIIEFNDTQYKVIGDHLLDVVNKSDVDIIDKNTFDKLQPRNTLLKMFIE